MSNIKKMKQAKIQEYLKKLVRHKGQVITNESRILRYQKVLKTTTKYSSRKINLEYKRLSKPKVEYWLVSNDEMSMYSIPKMIFDHCINDRGYQAIGLID